MNFSVKILLYKSKTLANGEHPLVIRFIKNRRPNYINIGQNCSIDLWDEKNNLPKRKHPNYNELYQFIIKLQADSQSIILRYKSEGKELTFDEFKQHLLGNTQNRYILEFLLEIIDNMNKAGQIKNAMVYKDCHNAVKAFLKNKDKPIVNIDFTFLNNFEQFLKSRALINNGKALKETTLSVYFRTLRAAYNKAIKLGFVKEENNPFKVFKISKFNTKTRKRALGEEDLKKILYFDATDYSKLEDAKNFFIFSFYCRGLNFTDLAELKQENIINGKLEYTRAKTGTFITLEILPKAQEIIDFYAPYSNGNYLFPILDPKIHVSLKSKANRIKKQLGKTNRALKEIAKLLDISSDKLTTYVARHSYATTLKRNNVSISNIKDLLGQSDERVTAIYLSETSTDELDTKSRNALADL